MNKLHYEEMVSALNELEEEKSIQDKKIYLFGHCNATEELIDLLISRGYHPLAILDNNENKHGKDYRGIAVIPPQEILNVNQEQTIVCIVARAYAAMSVQLRKLGYHGQIRKLVDYNSYAEYSLSEETICRMKKRVYRGKVILDNLNQKYSGYFKIFCPFSALGDIYYMMSYFPYFLKNRNINRCVICVIGNACCQVVQLFCSEGESKVNNNDCEYHIENFTQKDMDEMIQAALYTKDTDTFIAHQDRPYVVNLHKALYVKKIPLEQIYCCGVFGLPKDTVPVKPFNFKVYRELDKIPKHGAVILSPYAKSVTALHSDVWTRIVNFYKSLGKVCYTNVVGDEVPIQGTIAISPQIAELKSVVEQAGIFVGIRSGLCDVIKTADARKIALYPDYNYCDTKWRAIDIYYLDGWDNVEVKEGFEWKKN